MIQQLINLFYRYPKSRLKHISRFGGFWEYFRMERNRKLMEKSSVKLPPVTSDPNGLPIYFLTGKNYLYQTLFCILSLTKVTSTAFQFILVDDGTFDEILTEQVKRQLPGAVIIGRAAIELNLGKRLPKHQYPCLHHKRKVYPHIKKLTDLHTIAANDWKLVLDSDMLFWKEPTEIIAWLQNAVTPLHMVDCAESYGYSKSLMESLCGAEIKPLINVGAIGLSSSSINWDDIENWIKGLEEDEGSSYYLEQALTAMLIKDNKSTVLNAGRYVVNPIAVAGSGDILHHYVDLSKKLYFNHCWQLIV